MIIYFLHSFYPAYQVPPVSLTLAPGWICLTHSCND